MNVDSMQKLIFEVKQRKEAIRKAAFSVRKLANKKRMYRRQSIDYCDSLERMAINDDLEDADFQNNRKSAFLAAVRGC